MRLYDTLTGQKREFAPIEGKTVHMYVCGITPYSSSHVGHAFSVAAFDVLRRYLEFRGYTVKHVQNFTDIDDKIIMRAQQQGKPAAVIAEQYIDEYLRLLGALNIRLATFYPRATREVPRIIAMVQKLIERGFAYPAEGDVYYRVQKQAEYGKLAHRTLDGMMAGARVEVDTRKEHPMDFALWKAAKPGEPSWESPWGLGRPGWHIECSAMSLEYLGSQLDIHGGGADLIFPHHENEIAQSEAFTGVKPFVRFWMHNGLLTFGENKMSKSLGNLVTMDEALKRYAADTLRLFFASSHYRSALAFSDEGLSGMDRAAERMRFALRAGETGGAPLDSAPYRQRFIDAMEDDLNTPQAVAALFDLSRDINRGREEKQDVTKAQATLRELGGEVLGLTFRGMQVADAASAKPFIDLLVQLRTDMRKAKQFAMADSIRDKLAELGVNIEDTPGGTEWKLRTPEA